MDDEGGSKRRILHDPDSGGKKKDAPLLRSESPVRVYVPAIWPILHASHRSLPISEVCNINAQSAGYKTGCLHIQHFADGKLRSTSQGPHTNPDISARSTWVYSRTSLIWTSEIRTPPKSIFKTLIVVPNAAFDCSITPEIRTPP